MLQGVVSLDVPMSLSDNRDNVTLTTRSHKNCGDRGEILSNRMETRSNAKRYQWLVNAGIEQYSKG